MQTAVITITVKGEWDEAALCQSVPAAAAIPRPKKPRSTNMKLLKRTELFLAWLIGLVFFLAASPVLAKNLVADEERDPGSTPIGGVCSLTVAAALGAILGAGAVMIATL